MKKNNPLDEGLTMIECDCDNKICQHESPPTKENDILCGGCNAWRNEDDFEVHKETLNKKKRDHYCRGSHSQDEEAKAPDRRHGPSLVHQRSE
jgi:hypothetical protein